MYFNIMSTKQYKVIKLTVSAESNERILNELSSEGWDLITICPVNYKDANRNDAKMLQAFLSRSICEASNGKVMIG